MVDFHSHILPEIDDGSQSTEESLGMLTMLSEQKVEIVVATPHFRPNREKVDEFIKRRGLSFDKLKALLSENMPRILLGAEVQYYPGISRMEGIENLCIEGTKVLLLELPFERWTEMTVKEVIELSSIRNLTVVIAHIDRYIKFQKRDYINALLDNGVFFQSNPDFFTGFFTRNRAFSMLKNNEIHFLGSDCHNLTTRKPELQKATEKIRLKFGNKLLKLLTDNSKKFL